MKVSIRRLAWVGFLFLAPAVWATPPGPEEVPEGLDRRSPRATVDGFLQHAHAGDHAGAAHFLNLRSVPEAQQSVEGPKLARRLMFVLDRKLWLESQDVSSDPAGDPADGTQYELIGEVALEKGTQPIRLQRITPAGGGQAIWVFSSDTVRAIDKLYAASASPLTERLPDFFFSRPVWVLELWQWAGAVLLFGLALLLGVLLEKVALSTSTRLAKLTRVQWDDQVISAARGPLRWVFFSILFAAGARWLMFPPPALDAADLLARSLAIGAVAWFCLRFLRLMTRYINERVAGESPEDVARVRGLQTQVTMLRHVLEVAVVIIAGALVLMQFEVVRSVGVSLLASAGIAGLVIGFAAQKSIATLLAGIQLSITQPIRIGDSVIVEGEWGWIEEITLTYVVVKVWDLRRLVIPITYFLEKPFQNWSKVSPEILGTAEIRVDYTADVDAFRAELTRILENEGKHLWDGKAKAVQVTDSTDRIKLLRVLISAGNSGNAFDLRCIVREKMLAFVSNQHPEWLPVTRNETRVKTEAGPSAT
ncbi:MAG: mechanosensitive ion channel family protein [Myxococcaceae bacterium]